MSMNLSANDQARATAHGSPFHPLEIIPYFRRWKYSLGRDLLYTFIWNAAIGMLFSLFAFMAGGRLTPKVLLYNQIFAQVIGYTIHLLFYVGGHTIERWVVRQTRWVIALYYTAVATCGVVLGWLAAGTLLDLDVSRWLQNPYWLIGLSFNSLLISAIILAIYTSRERKIREELLLQAERARFAEIERNATLANLRLLQAQIEPHFLFNTLANVTSLIHPAPNDAKRMLENFIQYLRGSLAASRESTTTLGREFDLMQDLLSILKIRMGDRLEVAIDLPEELRDLSLPPMLIQPMVENAIRHGLEPKIEGGCLRLSARREAGQLEIAIADTGLGFSGATSSGVGLRNVRERLRALYGDGARLSIEDNAPCGTRILIHLPLETEPPAFSSAPGPRP